MKVTARDLDRLIFEIAPRDTKELRDTFRSELAAGRVRAQDPDKFYRWYLFNRAFDAGFRFEGSYRDAHIDTALRRAVVPLSEM